MNVEGGGSPAVTATAVVDNGSAGDAPLFDDPRGHPPRSRKRLTAWA